MKKRDVVLRENELMLTPVYKDLLPFLKPKKITSDILDSYSFCIKGPIGATIYNKSSQLIITQKGKRYWVVFYSPLQDMSHFKEDVIECLGKEKLVEEMPL